MAGAVSSILRDYDLKRSGALPVEESLALSLKGVAYVSSRSLCKFPCLVVSDSILSWMLTLCWVSVGGYTYEEFGKKGQTERGPHQSRQSLKGEGGCSYF